MCGIAPKSHLSVISHSAVFFPCSLLRIVELCLCQLELFSFSWPVPNTCCLKRWEVLVRDVANCCSGSHCSCLPVLVFWLLSKSAGELEHGAALAEDIPLNVSNGRRANRGKIVCTQSQSLVKYSLQFV